jgi:hypothetical protein
VLIGAALVAIVLFVLLGNVRAALLVTLTLPLSLALSGRARAAATGRTPGPHVRVADDLEADGRARTSSSTICAAFSSE